MKGVACILNSFDLIYFNWIKILHILCALKFEELLNEKVEVIAF